MGFFDDTVEQNPAVKNQRDADARAARLRGSLAEQLGGALFENRGRARDIINDRGRISNEQRARLGNEIVRNARLAGDESRDLTRGRGLSGETADALAGARGRAFRGELATNRAALASDQENRSRADLANIFGGLVLQPAVGVANLDGGTVKAKKGRRNAFDRFLDGVNKGVGDFQGV